MTEEQVTAKVMRIGSDLGISGHVTTKQIILSLENSISLNEYIELYNLYATNWKFGDVTHIELINIIEEILQKQSLIIIRYE